MNNYIPKGIYQVDGLPLQISALESTNVRLIACGENHFLSLSGMNSFPKKKKAILQANFSKWIIVQLGKWNRGAVGAWKYRIIRISCTHQILYKQSNQNSQNFCQL